MSFASWLYCMPLALRTLTGMGLKPFKHVEGELCPSPPLGAHDGSGSDSAWGNQGLAARLLSAVADGWQPGCLEAS